MQQLCMFSINFKNCIQYYYLCILKYCSLKKKNKDRFKNNVFKEIIDKTF